MEVSFIDFLNRTEEIDIIKSVLKSNPQLSVITGPVNSGRLLLICKVTEDIRKDEKTPVLYEVLASTQ